MATPTPEQLAADLVAVRAQMAADHQRQLNPLLTRACRRAMRKNPAGSLSDISKAMEADQALSRCYADYYRARDLIDALAHRAGVYTSMAKVG